MDTIEKLQALLMDRDARRLGGMRILPTLPRIECADGFSMSVQAGEFLYSTPRENTGPWRAVEIGFPSEACPELMPFAEDADKPTDTVYSYVPIRVVAYVIDRHGGIKSE
jgi:hypothetical protein